MAKIIVFGILDTAELAHYYLTHDSEHEVVAFTVNRQYIEQESFHSLPVVAFEDIENIFPPSEYHFFAPMTGRNMNRNREAIYNHAKGKGYQFISYISSRATIFDKSVIGENCFILEDNHDSAIHYGWQQRRNVERQPHRTSRTDQRPCFFYIARGTIRALCCGTLLLLWREQYNTRLHIHCTGDPGGNGLGHPRRKPKNGAYMSGILRKRYPENEFRGLLKRPADPKFELAIIGNGAEENTFCES